MLCKNALFSLQENLCSFAKTINRKKNILRSVSYKKPYKLSYYIKIDKNTCSKGITKITSIHKSE